MSYIKQIKRFRMIHLLDVRFGFIEVVSFVGTRQLRPMLTQLMHKDHQKKGARAQLATGAAQDKLYRFTRIPILSNNVSRGSWSYLRAGSSMMTPIDRET